MAIRKYKPTTPGRRGASGSDFSEITRKSLRNVPAVHLLDEDQLNTYDVLASDYVVFTKAALGVFVERGSQ